MAKYDFRQVESRASNLGMNIDVLNCQGSTLVRKCVYVAWEGTTATNGTGSQNCTNGQLMFQSQMYHWISDS